MNEEWRPIPSCPYYEASSTGRVRRVAPYLSTFVGKVLSPTSDKRSKYQKVGLSHDGKRKTCLVHRLVAEAFIGQAPSGSHEVAHRNGCRGDNSASNLRWSTKSENEKDKEAHGTKLQGDRVWLTKISDHRVRLMRARFAFGERIVETSRLFGVRYQHAWEIVHGRQRRSAGGYGVSDE